ncbi:MAG: ABC transporter permease [Propionibacteriaceae bacterium]|jgi:oligopeptide transport system permease protein|nr:ABC transporter permease [Propionibacteriaceae bacterium]
MTDTPTTPTPPVDPEVRPVKVEPPSPAAASSSPVVLKRKTSAAKSRSLWGDAWEIMRRRPLFWIAAALIFVFLVMTVFPQLFTSKDPGYCNLSLARVGPGDGAVFGYDAQGCDVWARTVYGARASILVGLLTALVTAVVGGLLGMLAGYLGGWVDVVLSRLADIFFAIPLLLGAIVLMYSIPSSVDSPMMWFVLKVVLAMMIFGWPPIFRLMRSSVLQVKPNEYVLAARALGAGPLHVVGSHILPNALTPVIVVSTIDLGGYIVTESTLSFLGIGLPDTVMSWGRAIARASELGLIRQVPHMLLFPALFLCLTVLSFILMGEVVRDALDPKLR